MQKKKLIYIDSGEDGFGFKVNIEETSEESK